MGVTFLGAWDRFLRPLVETEGGEQRGPLPGRDFSSPFDFFLFFDFFSYFPKVAKMRPFSSSGNKIEEGGDDEMIQLN